jgi:hypothetical protein
MLATAAAAATLHVMQQQLKNARQHLIQVAAQVAPAMSNAPTGPPLMGRQVS